MGSFSSVMKPHELVEHRKLNTAVENVEIPARPESRTLTDKKGFVIFAIAILILLPFLIYTLVKSDLRHVTHQTDSCGNFCGEKNEKIDGIACSGQDYTLEPYGNGVSCMTSCPRNSKTCWKSMLMFSKGDFNDRAMETLFQEDSDNVEVHTTMSYKGQWWKFIVSIAITITLSIVVLILLRYMPAPVVWFIIIFSMVVLVVLVLGAWVLYFNFNPEEYIDERDGTTVDKSSVLAFAVVITIIAAIILIVFIVLFKRIGLVVQLYKEATKALAAMPLLVLIPIVVAVVQILVVITAVVTTFGMMFSQELYQVSESEYVYYPTGVMVFTIIFNLVVTVWTMRFIDGIQYMVVSGSVSTWYFARNKEYLGSPISTSLRTTFKFHLGTAAFGSFLLTLFSVVKAIIKSVCRNACCRCCFALCCNNLDLVLKFLSENAYIQTSMHGQSFLRSAKRATKLLVSNAASVIAINCVGDFVLLVIVLLLTIVTTGISYALFMSGGYEYAALPALICFVVNLIIICIIFATFQAIIDTLFLCFCEDSVLNDGMARPYYMSTGLMEFVENSKKLYAK